MVTPSILNATSSIGSVIACMGTVNHFQFKHDLTVHLTYTNFVLVHVPPPRFALFFCSEGKKLKSMVLLQALREL